MKSQLQNNEFVNIVGKVFPINISHNGFGGCFYELKSATPQNIKLPVLFSNEYFTESEKKEDKGLHRNFTQSVEFFEKEKHERSSNGYKKFVIELGKAKGRKCTVQDDIDYVLYKNRLRSIDRHLRNQLKVKQLIETLKAEAENKTNSVFALKKQTFHTPVPDIISTLDFFGLSQKEASSKVEDICSMVITKELQCILRSGIKVMNFDTKEGFLVEYRRIVSFMVDNNYNEVLFLEATDKSVYVVFDLFD